MAATFIKAQGYDVGASPVEDDRVGFAKKLIECSERGDARLMLPNDVVVADAFAEHAEPRTVRVDAIPRGFRIMDIGTWTARRYAVALRECNTVIWNGPLGRVRVGGVLAWNRGLSPEPSLK